MALKTLQNDQLVVNWSLPQIDDASDEGSTSACSTCWKMSSPARSFLTRVLARSGVTTPNIPGCSLHARRRLRSSADASTLLRGSMGCPAPMDCGC